MLVMVRKGCSWRGKSYLSLSANWFTIVKTSSQGWCHIDGVVKSKTMEGKNEKE
jgi:hypothetical protein